MSCICDSDVFCLDYWSESDQDEIDGSMTLKQEATYHHNPSVSINSRLSTHLHTFSPKNTFISCKINYFCFYGLLVSTGLQDIAFGAC